MNELLSWGVGVIIWGVSMWILLQVMNLDKTPYDDEQTNEVADSARAELESLRKDGLL